MKFAAALSLFSLVGSTSAFAPSFGVSRSAGSALDMARKPFISGNWKLNPQSKDEAVTLATDIAASITDSSPDADVALFVPYVFIEAAMESAGGKIKIGAEGVCPENNGAFTGVSSAYDIHLWKPKTVKTHQAVMRVS